MVENHVLVANEHPSTVHETVNGVNVARVSVEKGGAVAICPTFPYWMRRLDGEVMVVHEPNPVAIVAHALVRPKSRLIFWVHAEVDLPGGGCCYCPFLRRMLRLADHIVVASPQVAEQVSELQPHRDKVRGDSICHAPRSVSPTPADVDYIAGATADPTTRTLRWAAGGLQGVDVLLRDGRCAGADCW